MEDPFLQLQNDEPIDLKRGDSMLGTHRDVRNSKITKIKLLVIKNGFAGCF